MKRREVFVLVKNLAVSFFLSGLLSGCEYTRSKKASISSLVPEVAFFLGYLLYGDNPPLKEIAEIEKHLKSITRNSYRKKWELESVCDRIAQDEKYSSFTALSSAQKEDYFKEIMPLIENSPLIREVLKYCLRGERVLNYLDYPDLPGVFGECGWIVIEGVVWDRYYPPSAI